MGAPRTGRDALTGRVPAIDGLRVIALLVIFAQHSGLGPSGKGGIAVDVFFVISGFVITRLLVKEYDATGRISVRRFYLARWRRLIPAAVVLCMVVLVVSLVVGGRWKDEWVYALLALTSTIDLAAAQDHISRLLINCWSLSVEEQYYLLWPLALSALLGLAARRRRPLLPLVLISAVCVVPLVERICVRAAGFPSYVYYSPDTRTDQLLMGCGLALLLRYFGDAPLPGWLIVGVRRTFWPAAAVLGVAAATWTTLPKRGGLSAATYLTVGMTVTGVLSVLVIAGFVLTPADPLSRLIGWRPLAWMGREWSYGFYLWHWPAIAVLNRVGGRHHTWWAFVATLAAAIASWWCVERHFRRRPARARSVQPGAAPALSRAGEATPAWPAWPA